MHSGVSRVCTGSAFPWKSPMKDADNARRAAGSPVAGALPLRRLLHLVQGDPAPALADPGLAQLGDADLADATALACAESMHDLDCSALLLRLLASLRERGEVDVDLAREVTCHAARLIRGHRVWYELACNAADHLDRP